jgi:hypothetical protein
MTQTWDNLLFAHWPIDPAAMRRVVPSVLDLDLYDGKAWIGIVPFDIPVFRPRFFPNIPPLTAFPELNVRTYVTKNGKGGIYFFSLDAAHILAVIGARIWFSLPYFFAQMAVKKQGDNIHYIHRRTHPGAPPGEWRADYGPTGPVQYAAPGSLDEWLTERYCLYAVNRAQQIIVGEIHHVRWPLQPAQLTEEVNHIALPVSLPDTTPLLHYSAHQETLVWPPYRL